MPPHDLHVRGARLRVHESGDPDGPVVVLQHGWPQTSRAWRHIAPKLADDGYRVLCPDLRGLGESSAPESGYRKDELTLDLIGILDELDVERASIVGHDWGGWIAFQAGLRFPERVERIAAVGIAHPWGGFDPRLIIDAPRFSYALTVALPVIGPRLTQLAARTFLKGDAQQLRDLDRAKATQHLYRSFPAERLTAPKPGPLPVPGLYVRLERDPVVTSRVVAGWEAAGPNLRYACLDGVGHFVLGEAPDRLLALLRPFLAEGADRLAASGASSSGG
jgi:pimeloyl-ACP methyl ester carboxylesterase